MPSSSSVLAQLRGALRGRASEAAQRVAVAMALSKLGAHTAPTIEVAKRDGITIRIYTWRNTPFGDIALVAGPSIEPKLHDVTGKDGVVIEGATQRPAKALEAKALLASMQQRARDAGYPIAKNGRATYGGRAGEVGWTRAELIDYLRKHPDGITVKELVAGFGGYAQAHKAALEQLVRNGLLVTELWARGGKHYRLPRENPRSAASRPHAHVWEEKYIHEWGPGYWTKVCKICGLTPAQIRAQEGPVDHTDDGERGADRDTDDGERPRRRNGRDAYGVVYRARNAEGEEVAIVHGGEYYVQYKMPGGTFTAGGMYRTLREAKQSIPRGFKPFRVNPLDDGSYLGFGMTEDELEAAEQRGAIAAMSHEEKLERQDDLDALYQERIIAVRNALRELGWEDEPDSDESALTKRFGGAGSHVLTMRFVHGGAGRNLLGMSWVIDGGRQEIDDDGVTPIRELAALIDQEAVPAETRAFVTKPRGHLTLHRGEGQAPRAGSGPVMDRFGEGTDLGASIAAITDPRSRTVRTSTGGPGVIPMTSLVFDYSESGLLPENIPLRTREDAEELVNWLNEQRRAARGERGYWKTVITATWADGAVWRARFDADGRDWTNTFLFGEEHGGGITWDNTTQKDRIYQNDPVFMDVPPLDIPRLTGIQRGERERTSHEMQTSLAKDLARIGVTPGIVYHVRPALRPDDSFDQETWIRFELNGNIDGHPIPTIERMTRDGEITKRAATDGDTRWYSESSLESTGSPDWPDSKPSKKLVDLPYKEGKNRAGAGPENRVLKAVLAGAFPDVEWRVTSGKGTGYGWSHVDATAPTPRRAWEAKSFVSAMGFSGSPGQLREWEERGSTEFNTLAERYDLWIPYEWIAYASAVAEGRKVKLPRGPAIEAVPAESESSYEAAERVATGRAGVSTYTSGVELYHNEEDGTVAKGDTRPIKDVLKAWGFRWYKAGGFWYIPRSRGKAHPSVNLAEIARQIAAASPEVGAAMAASELDLALVPLKDTVDTIAKIVPKAIEYADREDKAEAERLLQVVDREAAKIHERFGLSFDSAELAPLLDRANVLDEALKAHFTPATTEVPADVPYAYDEKTKQELYDGSAFVHGEMSELEELFQRLNREVSAEAVRRVELKADQLEVYIDQWLKKSADFTLAGHGTSTTTNWAYEIERLSDRVEEIKKAAQSMLATHERDTFVKGADDKARAAVTWAQQRFASALDRWEQAIERVERGEMSTASTKGVDYDVGDADRQESRAWNTHPSFAAPDLVDNMRALADRRQQLEARRIAAEEGVKTRHLEKQRGQAVGAAASDFAILRGISIPDRREATPEEDRKILETATSRYDNRKIAIPIAGESLIFDVADGYSDNRFTAAKLSPIVWRGMERSEPEAFGFDPSAAPLQNTTSIVNWAAPFQSGGVVAVLETDLWWALAETMSTDTSRYGLRGVGVVRTGIGGGRSGYAFPPDIVVGTKKYKIPATMLFATDGSMMFTTYLDTALDDIQQPKKTPSIPDEIVWIAAAKKGAGRVVLQSQGSTTWGFITDRAISTQYEEPPMAEAVLVPQLTKPDVLSIDLNAKDVKTFLATKLKSRVKGADNKRWAVIVWTKKGCAARLGEHNAEWVNLPMLGFLSPDWPVDHVAINVALFWKAMSFIDKGASCSIVFEKSGDRADLNPVLVLQGGEDHYLRSCTIVMPMRQSDDDLKSVESVFGGSSKGDSLRRDDIKLNRGRSRRRRNVAMLQPGAGGVRTRAMQESMALARPHQSHGSSMASIRRAQDSWHKELRAVEENNRRLDAEQMGLHMDPTSELSLEPIAGGIIYDEEPPVRYNPRHGGGIVAGNYVTWTDRNGKHAEGWVSSIVGDKARIRMWTEGIAGARWDHHAGAEVIVMPVASLTLLAKKNPAGEGRGTPVTPGKWLYSKQGRAHYRIWRGTDGFYYIDWDIPPTRYTQGGRSRNGPFNTIEEAEGTAVLPNPPVRANRARRAMREFPDPYGWEPDPAGHSLSAFARIPAKLLEKGDVVSVHHDSRHGHQPLRARDFINVPVGPEWSTEIVTAVVPADFGNVLVTLNHKTRVKLPEHAMVVIREMPAESPDARASRLRAGMLLGGSRMSYEDRQRYSR